MVACLTPPPILEPTAWVEQYGDYLYNYALGQLHDRTAAQDLVQETFLAALKARDRFSGYSSERTWLVSILRHKICDYFRYKCREARALNTRYDSQENRVEQSMLWLHETAVECLSPSRHIDLQDFRRSLEIALGALPPRIAQAFTLYELEEHPGAEVCRQLEISAANLWTMVHRARRQLRQRLSNWRDEVNDSSGTC